jgi:cation/acetate symporter
VLGMFWKRANGPGAVAGMLAGLALCLGYMAATAPAARRFLGVPGSAEAARWFDIAPTSAAVFAVPLGLAVIVGISLLTAPPAPQQRALLERLRVPGPSET